MKTTPARQKNSPNSILGGLHCSLEEAEGNEQANEVSKRFILILGLIYLAVERPSTFLVENGFGFIDLGASQVAITFEGDGPARGGVALGNPMVEDPPKVSLHSSAQTQTKSLFKQSLFISNLRKNPENSIKASSN